MLIVDDEPLVVSCLRQALRKEPFDVVTATSGDEALKIFDAGACEVVISDEKMPRMTGPELLTRIRRLSPSTLRIILTGNATLSGAIQSINEGEVYRYLAKPCDTGELARVVLEGLRLRSLVKAHQADAAGDETADDDLRALEARYPGITSLMKDPHGALLVPEETETMDEVLEEMQAPALPKWGENR